MNGYTVVFDNAVAAFKETTDKESLYDSFRIQRSVYGFIDNGDCPPDEEAVTIAKNIDESLYDKFVDHNRNRAIIGYGSIQPRYAAYSNLDSRHIMMSVHLLTHLKKTVIPSIVEIGGGFGNWLRLHTGMISFTKWSIVDLAHLNRLQEWALAKDAIDRNTYELIEAGTHTTWAANHTSFDLVLGTHSMSEFSLPIFIDYFYSIVMKTKYFYYAYHNTRPSPDLIKTKLDLIELHFHPIHSMVSEGGNVTNCLYVRKTK